MTARSAGLEVQQVGDNAIVAGQITNEKEYEAALNQITDLSLKEDQIRPGELALLKLLAALVHEYESERWPRKRGKSTYRKECIVFELDLCIDLVLFCAAAVIAHLMIRRWNS